MPGRAIPSSSSSSSRASTQQRPHPMWPVPSCQRSAAGSAQATLTLTLTLSLHPSAYSLPPPPIAPHPSPLAPRPSPLTPRPSPLAPHPSPPTHVQLDLVEEEGSNTNPRAASTTSMEIGMPTNFKHVAHIGWDDHAGFQTQNLPAEWKQLFRAAGVKRKDLEDISTARLIVRTLAEQMTDDQLAQLPHLPGITDRRGWRGDGDLPNMGDGTMAAADAAGPPPPTPLSAMAAAADPLRVSNRGAVQGGVVQGGGGGGGGAPAGGAQQRNGRSGGGGPVRGAAAAGDKEAIKSVSVSLVATPPRAAAEPKENVKPRWMGGGLSAGGEKKSGGSKSSGVQAAAAPPKPSMPTGLRGGVMRAADRLKSAVGHDPRHASKATAAATTAATGIAETVAAAARAPPAGSSRI